MSVRLCFRLADLLYESQQDETEGLEVLVPRWKLSNCHNLKLPVAMARRPIDPEGDFEYSDLTSFARLETWTYETPRHPACKTPRHPRESIPVEFQSTFWERLQLSYLQSSQP